VQVTPLRRTLASSP